jgi:hypothetical protein
MATRMLALVCGAALLVPSCASVPAVKKHPAAEHHDVYLFGAGIPGDSLICVDRPFSPDPDCMTLGRLRRMVRETSGN